MKMKWKSEFLHGADYNCDQWLDRPDILETDIEYMKKCGCNVMAVGIFSWSKFEPLEGQYDFSWMDEVFERLYGNGISIILATPSGSKPAWMSWKYPETCRVGSDGIREPHGYRHNHCRSSRVYREKTARINTLLAERYGKHPGLILWHVSNEYSGAPCYCSTCISAFHEWLEKKYGTLEKLNASWWTGFWSHQFSSWDEIYPSDISIHGMLLDWQRFTSDLTLDFFKNEFAPLRRISPEVPLTTNFMQPDVGLDYWSFAEHIDVISWDSYPRWHSEESDVNEAVRTAFFHDIHRSYRDSPFLLMESTPGATNWQGMSKHKKPGMHLLSSMQAVAHGSASVQYFQWRQSRGGEEKFHSAVVSHTGSDDSRLFREVAAAGTLLKKLKAVSGSITVSQTALIYDFHNSWALDLAQLPNNLEKHYQQQCIMHYSSFWKKGIPVDIKDSLHCDFSRYSLIIVPMLYMLRERTAEKIKNFVQNGGTVVLTYLSGVAGDTDLCFTGELPGGLSEVLGLKLEYNDAVMKYEQIYLEPVDGSSVMTAEKYAVLQYADVVHVSSAEVLAVYRGGPAEGMPAVTVNRFGSGHAYYIAARTGSDFLDDFYGHLSEELKPDVPWCIPEGVSVRKRESDGRQFIFVMNFNSAGCFFDTGNEIYTDSACGKEISGKCFLEAYGVTVLEK